MGPCIALTCCDVVGLTLAREWPGTGEAVIEKIPFFE